MVFVGDDLGYELSESIQVVVAPLLRGIGYSDFGTDPAGIAHVMSLVGVPTPFTHERRV